METENQQLEKVPEQKTQHEIWQESAVVIGKSFKAWREGINLSDHDEATKAQMSEYCESLINGASMQFKLAGFELVIK